MISEFAALVGITLCVFWEIPLILVNFRWKIDWVIYKDFADGLRKRIWNSEIVKALWQGFGQGGLPVLSLVSELYRKCSIDGMSYICAQLELIFFWDALIDDEKFIESFQHDLFNTDTIRDFGHALHDSNSAMDFFIAAIAHGISFHFLRANSY
jgi:hypothetical protein